MNTNILKTRYEMKRQKLAHEGIFYFFSNISKKKIRNHFRQTYLNLKRFYPFF